MDTDTDATRAASAICGLCNSMRASRAEVVCADVRGADGVRRGNGADRRVSNVADGRPHELRQKAHDAATMDTTRRRETRIKRRSSKDLDRTPPRLSAPDCAACRLGIVLPY